VEGWFGWAPDMNWMTWHRKIYPKNAGRKQNVLRKFGLITARTGETRLFTVANTSCENEVTF